MKMEVILKPVGTVVAAVVVENLYESPL